MSQIKIRQIEPDIGEEEIANVVDALKRKWITEGKYAKEFSELIKEETGSKYVVLVSNGTLGLYLSLLALGVGSGDEVVVPNFTFVASGASVAFTGAKPVFADVNISNYTIDVEEFRDRITSRTKAVMPVHIYGQAVDMDPILTICRENNIKIIEDAAQGYGVKYKGTHTGALGDVGVISFFADKTITTGEGAAILTNDKNIYEQLCYLRNHGRLNSGTFIHPKLGMNFRITDLQCAIGVAQAKKFNKTKENKLKNYLQYKKQLMGNSNIIFASEPEYSNIIPFRANILAQSAKKLMKHLENNGIETRSFFYPLHRQPCFANYIDVHEFPVSEKLFNDGVSLPIHSGLSEEDIKYICDSIRDYYKGEL